MCALRFLDSFDHYTTLTQKWTSAGVTNSIVAGAARTGAQGMRSSGGGASPLSLTLDAQGTWIIGVAFRANAALGTGIIQTVDAAVGLQGALRINADNTFSIYVGGVWVATSVRSILLNVWYYIEFKHIIDNVAGTLEVRVDGIVWATFAGDTQATVNPTANIVAVGRSVGATGNWDFDDLYILDGTGGAPCNNYLGNREVRCLLPSGAGTYTEFVTLVGAASHWEAEDEVPPDEDTSYVEENVVDDRDTYAFADLPAGVFDIPGIQIMIRAKQINAGARELARMYRSAGADNQGADVVLGLSYAYIREILELDPIAAGVWTKAVIDAAEFGARVRD